MNDSGGELRKIEAELVSCYLVFRRLAAAQLGEPAWSQQLLPLVATDAEDDLAARIRAGLSGSVKVNLAVLT